MSNGNAGIRWRFLIVENDTVILRQLEEACAGFVDAPDTAEPDLCSNFSDAMSRLDSQRYDMVILDLIDEGSELFGDAGPPGLKIFEEIKRRRFVPVVFFTAHPAHVLPTETTFVRVVEKTVGIPLLQREVRKIFSSRLPAISRHIEDHQREYMWDFVSTHWKDFESPHQQTDLAYLLARRLAHSLEGLADKLATNVSGAVGSPADEAKAHPMTMYIKPPIESKISMGDILLEKSAAAENYWIILTPSCDFAHDKVKHVVLAKCEKLEEQKEYKDWVSNTTAASKKERLEKLIGDNRQGKDALVGLQQERFKFLPGTFFLPNLLVDFQQLRSVSLENLKTFKQITTLDSPFAEAMLARFAHYFGRLGTPDIDKKVVLDRLQAALAKSAAGQPDSSSAS